MRRSDGDAWIVDQGTYRIPVGYVGQVAVIEIQPHTHHRSAAAKPIMDESIQSRWMASCQRLLVSTKRKSQPSELWTRFPRTRRSIPAQRTSKIPADISSYDKVSVDGYPKVLQMCLSLGLCIGDLASMVWFQYTSLSVHILGLPVSQWSKICTFCE
jgi:hypothetical protein